MAIIVVISFSQYISNIYKYDINIYSIPTI